jgi:precorrin-6B methylase 2
MIIELTILLLALIGAWILYPIVFGAVWQPTPMDRVRRMLEMAEVGPGDLLYDLGSGDGRIVITAARDFEARAVGIEVDPILVSWSRFRIRAEGLEDRARVVWGNLFKEDLGEATVVTVFLRKGINNALREKLRGELRPGARVVSYLHTFDGWATAKVDEALRIYLYMLQPD